MSGDPVGQRFQPFTRLAAVILLVIGCLFVLRPFLAAILFACAIAISSWPLYLRLLDRVQGRRWLAAIIMSVGLTLLIVVPLTLVTWNIADNASEFYDHFKGDLDTGALSPPAWLKDIPIVGDVIDTYLRKLLGSRDELVNTAKGMLEPARHFLLGSGMVLGSGVAQVSLAVFVSFFLYRDGQNIVVSLSNAMNKLIGAEHSLSVSDTVSRTLPLRSKM